MMLFICGSSVENSNLVGAQPNSLDVVNAVSQEGHKVQWDTYGNSEQSLCSGERIILSGEYEKDVNGEPKRVYYHKVHISDEEDGWLTEGELDAVSNWKEFSRLELSKDQSSVVYLKLVDLQENTTYLNTGVLTIDTHKPIIEKFATNVEDSSKCANGIFCADVPITISVMEPVIGKSYSGIQTVWYQVFSMGVETQQGVLYHSSKQVVAQKDLVKNWKDTFVVDSQLNNSNHVEVVLHVRDFAGNMTSKSMKLKIDISKPVIRVSYDNNQVKNGSYFSENRTATISILERNFSPEDVQIQIENSEGAIPKISDWKKTEGFGNLDNTKWTLEIPYTEEGDYLFAIKCWDLARNFNREVDYGTSVSPIKFTIDKTRPIVQVRYDNNDVKNEMYYCDKRTAIIEVEEHNLDVKDIRIALSADFGEKQGQMPNIQGWSRDGDFHTASILYVENGTYTFQIDVVDKAGNRAVTYEEETFCIDTVFPSVMVSGVKHHTSTSGEIHLEIVCTDENYTEKQVGIYLKKYDGKNGEKIENISYQKKYLEHGVHYIYEDIPNVKDFDGSYELQVEMTDQAGNCTEKSIQFSVNRFGSSYRLGEEIKKINHYYLHTPVDLIVEETNVDELINRKIILFKNGEAILLKEGNDYFVEVQKVEGNYQYTYTILKENFKENGSYQISISSEDEAGNFSSNDRSGEGGKIRFGMDTVKPTLVVYNLKNGGVYEADVWTVNLSVKDNFNLRKVEIYLDDKMCRTWTGQELKDMQESNGTFSFTIAGDTMSAHQVKIVCLDEAGNECLEKISRFYVTTNRWIYLWKNKVLISGIIATVVLLGAIIFRIVHKKRSNPLSNFEK